jgi:hypothetical protein
VPDPVRLGRVVIDVESHPERSYLLPDGRLMPDVVFTVTPEARERIRLGYMCCNCLEPFIDCWPENCGVCGFPVKERQMETIDRQMYDDPSVVAPGIPVDREMEYLQRRFHEAHPAMKVPKGKR